MCCNSVLKNWISGLSSQHLAFEVLAFFHLSIRVVVYF